MLTIDLFIQKKFDSMSTAKVIGLVIAHIFLIELFYMLIIHMSGFIFAGIVYIAIIIIYVLTR